jgi:hypothetical protein
MEAWFQGSQVRGGCHADRPPSTRVGVAPSDWLRLRLLRMTTYHHVSSPQGKLRSVSLFFF